MPNPPILEVRRLSVRFGGLTAVCDVDLAVEPKTIFSVIGPNGAGKSTLFNCITGVTMPTGGSIRIAGRTIERQWSWRAAAACVAVGLACGLALFAAALDLNGLWRAAVRRPTSFSATPFSYRESWRQTVAYLRGDLAIERVREGRWQIVSADGRTPLGMFPSRDAAAERLATLAEIGRGRSNRWIVLIASFLAGAAFGASGTLAAWRRSRWTPDLVARAGVARTFQNLRLFKSMTVHENVLVALEQAEPGCSRLDVRARKSGKVVHRRRAAEVDAILRRVGLAAVSERRAGQLAYGDQRRLEIGRALATRPRLLLLDEPAAGMNRAETAALIQLVRGVREEGITVVLIEHQMELVMGISDRIAVLDGGRKIAEGTAEDVRRNPVVLAAYLGEPNEGSGFRVQGSASGGGH
ncbi:MAG TPA: ABC transporter ATP-binding protein [Pirellulales bacterium]|nr:ABC transporter ATP-binding protein [Pirellulales bacterium]